MSGQPEAIHLFSNGSEFDFWESGNCPGCVKRRTCDILDALFTDSITHDLPNGSVTPETAERIGYTHDRRNDLRWTCKERQERSFEPPHEPAPSPAVREMRRAGAAMLPGLDQVPEKPAERGQPWTA